MNNRTRAYFDDVILRAASATPVPRDPCAAAGANECHKNCEEYTQLFPEYQVVRGWYVLSGYWLMPHSVVREKATGKLIDITPDPSDSGAISFVEHVGTEDEFAVLRRGRDGGYLYPERDLSPHA